MNRSDIKNELLTVLGEFTKDKSIVITEEMDLVNDLKIKSAKMVDIILVFEERYDIEVEPEDMDEMFTVKETIDILEKYLK